MNTGLPESGFSASRRRSTGCFCPGSKHRSDLRGTQLTVRWHLLLLINVEQSAALLDSPFYMLRKTGEADWTGTIVETGSEYRRALRFKSLDDILDSYMNSSEPEQSDNLILRSVAGHDELFSEESDETGFLSPEATSYFPTVSGNAATQ